MRSDLITFIVPCMGRLHHLKQTLPKLASMFPVVVVDYSCPEKSGQWAENIPGVSVNFVHHQKYFCNSASRNAGVQFVRTPWVGFTDADVIFSDNAKAALDLTVSGLAHGNVWVGPKKQIKGYSGTCIVRVTDFHRAGGYPEIANPNYGGEDSAFYEILGKLGLQKVDFPDVLQHIEHGDDERVMNYPEKDISKGYGENFPKYINRVADFKEKAP